MKLKIKHWFVGAIIVMSISSCNQDQIVPENKLPIEISNYIKPHFPNNKVIQAMEDNEWFYKSYEVMLQGGIKLDFDKHHNIQSIDGNTKLPDSVIPKMILTYVAINFPTSSIIGWEIDRHNQQIELDNKLDLEFTMQGEFLRIED